MRGFVRQKAETGRVARGEPPRPEVNVLADGHRIGVVGAGERVSGLALVNAEDVRGGTGHAAQPEPDIRGERLPPARTGRGRLPFAGGMSAGTTSTGRRPGEHRDRPAARPLPGRRARGRPVLASAARLPGARGR